VAKRKDSQYRATEKPSPYWIKVKNRNYSQVEGRDELFNRTAQLIDHSPRTGSQARDIRCRVCLKANSGLPEQKWPESHF
jgi:hypothetical protein